MTTFKFDPVKYLASSADEPDTVRVELMPNGLHTFIKKEVAASPEFRAWSLNQLVDSQNHPEAKRLKVDLSEWQPYHIMAALVNVATQRDYFVFLAAASVAHPDKVKVQAIPEDMPVEEPSDILQKTMWHAVKKADLGFPQVKLVRSGTNVSHPFPIPALHLIYSLIQKMFSMLNWIMRR